MTSLPSTFTVRSLGSKPVTSSRSTLGSGSQPMATGTPSTALKIDHCRVEFLRSTDRAAVERGLRPAPQEGSSADDWPAPRHWGDFQPTEHERLFLSAKLGNLGLFLLHRR